MKTNKQSSQRKNMVRNISAVLGAAMLATTPVAGAAELVAPSEPFAVTQATAPAWDQNKAYSTGDKVTYNGKVYEAKWWTQGENPESSLTNPNSGWKQVGAEPNPNPGGGTDTVAPSVPTGLVSSNPTASTVTLSWSASTDNVGVTKYDIYRNAVKIGSATTTSYADTGLTANTAYSYTVIALDAAGNASAASTALSATTAATGNEGPGSLLPVGGSRVITDQQIQQTWGGIDAQYSPDQAIQAVTSALPRTEYEALFPLRTGTPGWHEKAAGKAYYKPGQTDYYSYDNLIAAVRDVANIKYKELYRGPSNWTKQIWRLDKTTKTETLLFEEKEFNAEWNIGKPTRSRIVDFGTFLKEGTEVNRKRELAAFLANISHETGGGWKGAPGGELSWALFFNEEVKYVNGQGGIGYVQSHSDYPAVAGKSYHGRGPIQLSWNYNYGLIGSIIFGDKNVLLNNPEKITDDGRLGFMTAMLFWMTPQDPKPSCHDIMVGNYVPTAAQLAKGLVPGFGATIMVINGAQEGNRDESDVRIGRRVAHYIDITSRAGVNIQGEKLNTLGMQAF
ncbi:glycoside hydrolase family 19 protein [Paenibacillus sp. 481]|uniref:glycoside hydrolase family 19 protein n=1 Tax=Paenibacillus sp. 481 TaxID=2835869 RepID=UPI001E366AD1|nr:glycoside hydrolase family 19 protein [Paenibacillus sp. 481]UHA73377.1 chitinase [Paenibacillus sp. 481]